MSVHQKCIIMGDFNLPWWGTGANMPGSHRIFVDCFEENFLQQLVCEPTRGSNILDLILANESDLVHSLEVGECLGNSDHNMIRFCLSFQHGGKDNNTLIPNFAKGRYGELKLFLADFEWSMCCQV